MTSQKNSTASGDSDEQRVGPREVDFLTMDATERAKKSPLWAALEMQDALSLPYMLERYLLLRMWVYRDRRDLGIAEYGEQPHDYTDEIAYLHMLLADATATLLSQEERIRKLEAAQRANTSLTGAEN